MVDPSTGDSTPRQRASEAAERAARAEERSQELHLQELSLEEIERAFGRAIEAHGCPRDADGEAAYLHWSAVWLHDLHAQHEREAGNEERARKADRRAEEARKRASKAERAWE